MYTTLTDLITISTITILLRSPKKGFKGSAVIPLTHLLWIFLSKLYPAPCIYLEFTMKKIKSNPNLFSSKSLIATCCLFD